MTLALAIPPGSRHIGFMQMPIGPSMELALSVVDGAGQLTLGALKVAWERWMGPARFQRKIDRLRETGLLLFEGTSADLDRLVRLTDAARVAAAGGRDPLSRWARAWDGHWRLVFFDVAEAKRTIRIRLQRRLRRAAFGYLQDSVWISPDSLDEVQAAIGASKVDAAALTFIEGRPCGGESDADLVRGAWDFGAINRNYEIHLEILRACPHRGSLTSRCNWLSAEWNSWMAALRSDPLLPQRLLPRPYLGREAWNRRQEVFRRCSNVG